MAFGWDSSNFNAHSICSMNVGVSFFWKFSMSLGYVSLCRTEHSASLFSDKIAFSIFSQGKSGLVLDPESILYARNILGFAKKYKVGCSGHTYHSDSSWPFVGPPSQMAWQQTIINCSRALRSQGSLVIEGCSEE